MIIGADDVGNKDIVGLSDGYRESEQSWLELLLELKRRGLEVAPELAVGDGALGFWKALRQAYGQTREQRCWVHKTAYRAKYDKAVECLTKDRDRLLTFYDFPAEHTGSTSAPQIRSRAPSPRSG